MRKRRATNRTLHTVAAIAVAALTATACGVDEPAVVEPVEPIPVETTEAPTTDADSPADVDAPAADEDVDPAAEQDETPATTTTETEVPASEDAVTEEAPSSAVIEDESAGELAGEPAVEELPLEDPEPGSDLNTAPGEPAVEQDETSQPDEASEPAPEPEPEEATEAPEQEQPETEQASQPVEPVEDALEPEPTDPWERVTNEPVLASELWPEGDENGNPYPDDDLYCHVPSGGEFECYYTTPEPEPEPEEAPEQEQPETEQASQPVEPVEDALEPEPTDPWERVTNEPVLASELWPEGDENGNPYPDDDLYCHVPSGGEFECYYTTPEPEPEPEPVVEDTEYDAFKEAVQQGQTWTGSNAPPVHPDTQPPSWVRGTDTGSGRPDDVPRLSVGVATWINWCRSNYGGNTGCEQMLFHMVWAIDYLGADTECVLANYRDRIQQGNNPNVADRYNDSRLINRFGWHKCATVVDPVQPDGRLLSQHGLSMAERCRAALPDDVKLEERPEAGRVGLGCNSWGAWVENRRTGSNDCDRSARLAEEWLEHYSEMPVRFYRISC